MSGSASSNESSLNALLQGLRELGYVEGKNLVLERRFADGQFERFPALLAELEKTDPQVLVTVGTTVMATKNMAKPVPVVFLVIPDPVAAGLAESLARPGGNYTGLATINTELAQKRLELLRDTLPKARKIGILFQPDALGNALQVQQTKQAAGILKMVILAFEVHRAEDISSAFAALAKWRADALIVMESGTTAANRQLVVELAARARLPAMYAQTQFVEVDGLMSYSVNYPSQYRRAAWYVDKILKGTRPGDLAVEQPTTFDLVVNMKTARALGIKFPSTIMDRATKVIE